MGMCRTGSSATRAGIRQSSTRSAARWSISLSGARTLGQMSIPMVHTWAVAIVFVLPALGLPGDRAPGRFAALDRAGWPRLSPLRSRLVVVRRIIRVDRVGPGHECARGRVDLPGAVAIAAGLSRANPRWFVSGAGLIAWAEYTNPRSLIAIATIAAAALIVWWLHRTSTTRSAFAWLVVPFALGLAASAPLLFSLIRYDHLYFFVHYSGYANLREWLDSSIQAVSGPVFIAVLVGLAITLVGRQYARRVNDWLDDRYLLCPDRLPRRDRLAIDLGRAA